MKLLLVKFKKRTRYKELQGLIMEETYNINNIDALLEELKEIAGELNEQILSNCPHKDINCIIGQLKGFYYNLNDNNLRFFEYRLLLKLLVNKIQKHYHCHVHQN